MKSVRVSHHQLSLRAGQAVKEGNAQRVQAAAQNSDACSRGKQQVLGIVKLIINNLRGTIFKCIAKLFTKLVGLIVPIPQQVYILEAMHSNFFPMHPQIKNY